jgi:cellulose biosynthesis protein BcsQ
VKVLACYNIKGGVGKTATAVNLAYLSATEGFRTLVWDLDPQGASSFYFRVKPEVTVGAEGLISGSPELHAEIKGTDYDNLDLLPSDFSYRDMDRLLDDASKPKRRLRKLLKLLEGDYDYVFLDCPPGITLLSENVFRAADVLLVPTIPTTLSLRTLHQLLRFCRNEGLSDFSILPFFTMVDLRRSLHRRIAEELPRQIPAMLASFIPYSSEIEQMGIHRGAVGSYAAHGRSARAFIDLWWEIKVRLEWIQEDGTRVQTAGEAEKIA